MKQIFQDLTTGVTEVIEAPAPQARPGYVVVETTVSLISPGTERMLVDFGRAGLVAKARQQPEKVVQVVEKIKTDGLLTTMQAVRSKLSQPLPLGYCNVGVVRESQAIGFHPGDRVVSNGPHSDVVCVPRNLCAKVPDNVSDEAAAFTVIASIGLQGIRLAKPSLGETFVVIGAGLIGLLTVQLLRAHGCRVLAIDFDPDRLALAREYGAEVCSLDRAQDHDPIASGLAFSRGAGVDGVIITASTKSNEPVTQAARMSRKRGRIILVGVTGLELNRADFYERELRFQVSCSYGPGRYDPNYEEQGHDYPLSFVRWTEQRNFEAVLDLMASGRLDVSKLITHRQPFSEAPKAYEALATDKRALGILLTYQHPGAQRHIRKVSLKSERSTNVAALGNVGIGFIGAGNYASRVLIPAFKSAGAALHAISSAGGSSAAVHGRRNGFIYATSDVAALIADPAISAVAIVTRHDTHAGLTAEALSAGKHVFVEKPLATTLNDLAKVEAAYQNSGRVLTVGFNRRFAPQVQTVKNLLKSIREPKVVMTVMNAGVIPHNHWTQSESTGGGRIIGEACHHVDLMRFLIGSPIISVQARRIGENDALQTTEDKAVIVLGFADGSFGTIHYLANGGSSFPKERIEVFVGGRTLQVDNFRKLRGFNWPGLKTQSLWRQNKGQSECAAAFLNAIKTNGPAPIPAEELFESTRVTIEAANMLRNQA